MLFYHSTTNATSTDTDTKQENIIEETNDRR